MLLQLKPKELEAVSGYWYLKIGIRWVGPASYIEVLQMLKGRKISRQSLIRAGDSKSEYGGDWHPISEIEEFTSSFIDGLMRYYAPINRSFDEMRKFVRVLYNAESIVVNNDGQVIKTLCSELSAGGAKITVPKNSLDEGQELMIHFFYNKLLKLKSFKAKAKVLRLSEICFENEGVQQDDSTVHESYAVEFEDLKPKHKKMLLKITQVKIKSLAAQLKQNNRSVVGVLDLSEFSRKYPRLVLNP